MADIHNLVNFLRGTYKAYNRLKLEGKIDDDVLYFISNPGDTKGTLYLGDILIGQGETSYLSQLADVETSNLKNKNILAYNQEVEKWMPTEISSLISEVKSQVYTIKAKENENFEDILNSFIQQNEIFYGDIVLIQKDNINFPYIFTDKWIDIGLNELFTTSIKKEVGQIKEQVGAINTAVGNLKNIFVTQENFNKELTSINNQLNVFTWQDFNSKKEDKN